MLRLSILLFAFSSFSSFILGQSNKMAIVDEYIDAVGGKSAWSKINSFHLQMTTHAKGQTYKMENFMLKPDCFKIIFDFGDSKKILSYDGRQGQIVENGKIQKMPADTEIEMAEEADFFDELIFHKERGYHLEYICDTMVVGTTYAKYAMTKSPYDIQFYYLNAKTKLLEIIEEYSEENKYEGVLFKTTLSEYAHVGDIMFPKKMALYGNDRLLGQYIFEQVTLNLPIKKEDFILE